MSRGSRHEPGGLCGPGGPGGPAGATRAAGSRPALRRLRQLPRAAARAAATLGWYWRGVTGADAYERYVDHLRRHHPEAPIPTERDFWRDKYDEMDRHPGARCC